MVGSRIRKWPSHSQISILVRQERRMGWNRTRSWPSLVICCSQSPRRKDGLKPNTKLAFIWSYDVHNRQEERMAWSRTRSWPSFGHMLFRIAKKKEWVKVKQEADLQMVTHFVKYAKKFQLLRTFLNRFEIHLKICYGDERKPNSRLT